MGHLSLAGQARRRQRARCNRKLGKLDIETRERHVGKGRRMKKVV
jgi:hypothetical protein